MNVGASLQVSLACMLKPCTGILDMKRVTCPMSRQGLLFGVKLSSVVQTSKCISELQEKSWNVVPFNIPCKNMFVCPWGSCSAVRSYRVTVFLQVDTFESGELIFNVDAS